MIPSHPPFRMWLRLSRRLGSVSRLFYNLDECGSVYGVYTYAHNERLLTTCCHVSELLSSPAPLKA